MSPPSCIRHALADDHQVFRRSLRQLLELQDDIQVVAEANNGVEALQAIATEQPAVRLLDLSMPVLDGLGVLTAARATSFQWDRGADDARRSGDKSAGVGGGRQGIGAQGFDSGEDVNAIRNVAAGRAWIEARAAVIVLEEYRSLNELAGRQSGGRLSDRDTA